jgi:PAS domain S-box-containing protein
MQESQGGAPPGPAMVLSEAQLAAVLGIAEDAVIIADRDQRIRFFNRGAEKIFGYPASEVLGQPLELLLPPEARSVHRQHVERFGMSGQVARHMGERGEIAGRRKDGSVFPAEASICRLQTPAGELYTAILRDVTERRRQAELMREAKEAAEAATQAKSLFLANMSHEIRTPLNAVIGMTSLLLDTPVTEEQRDFAQTIRSSGEALLSIINDILDYSKIELGKLELERHAFDLRRCVEESLDLLSPKAAEKNLNLAYIVEDSAPDSVLSDATRLRQILVNLVSNAVKFTQQGEVLVTVDATPAGDGRRKLLHFAVKDTGIGIPGDRLAALFQSFSQVDASTTRKYGGTGLGLAISKRLAEMMGGSMWVESQLGQGSTFHFTVLAEAAAGGTRDYLHQGSPALTGKRILIVDDNTTNRRILVKHALAWGMLPSAAASAIEALDLVRHGHAFDIAILDMAMPEMDGMGLALEIRKYRDSKALPLIMLTSMGQRQKGAAWERASFAVQISKPIKPSQLYDALVSTLDRQQEPRPRIEARLEAGMAQRLPLSILVAEDNAVNQKVLLRILDKLGYRADLAATGVEVLDALERQEYDLILMDVHMPELDGIEATRRIVQRFQGRRRPRIVAMTADALQGDRDRCLAAGMDAYLSKPVYIQELTAALEEAGREARCGPAAPEPFGSAAGKPPPPELVAQFRADAPRRLRVLWGAVTDGDGHALADAARRFRTMLGELGASRMAELCARIEDLGREGGTRGAAPLMEELDREYERVRGALEALGEPAPEKPRE